MTAETIPTQKVRVTFEVTLTAEDVLDYHPNYVARVIDSALMDVAKRQVASSGATVFGSWQLVEAVKVDE